MEKGPAASLPAQPGLEELRARRRESRALYWAAGLFSFFVNLLMLAGPLYMLLIYDRVLASQSVESLTALSLLLLFLYGIMAVLDVVRGRVMARVGARFQARLDRRVFEASLSAHRDGARGLADLDALRQFLSAPVFIALFDIPWTPVFLLAIFLFHPALGWLAFGGAALLVAAALFNQTFSRLPQSRAEGAGHTADRLSAEMRRERETLQGLGMLGAAFARWQRARRGALMDATAAADIGGSIHAMSRAFRLFLQSAMLGLGALLVLRGEVSAGAMIASSILLGRALAPVEQALAQWPLVMRAGRGWSALAGLLRAVPPARDRVEMPAPIGLLEVDRVTITAPGSKRAILSNISFSIAPGQACGVIGTSGAGKSALARAIIGLWPLASGTITLGGARIETYGSAALGRHLGYLPQRVALLEGTIAENIARFDPKAPDHAIIDAAKRAGAHEMIARLPRGYDTRLSQDVMLSGGQCQRIALARALYGDPALLIFDEPNSNLDHEGSSALNAAIRAAKAAGKAVLIIAHRPAAVQECDLLLMLDGGRRVAFGPRDEVLRDRVVNDAEIKRGSSVAGAA